MTHQPLTILDLPEPLLESLSNAGIETVGRLCTLTAAQVRSISGVRGYDDVKTIRKALAELGLDVRSVHEDPAGGPAPPSRQALRGLYERLDLMPDTRKALTAHLMGITTEGELLGSIDREDEPTILRLVDLWSRGP